MIDIKTLEIAGMASVLQALRLPYGKECRSYCSWSENLIQLSNSNKEIYYPSLTLHEIDDRDLNLLSVLVKRGDEHCKALRGLIVYAEINAPRFFWVEADTYRIGTERLGSESTIHIQGQGLSVEELVKMKEELKEGTMQKRIQYFSYPTLRRIWIQRHNHKLPHWHKFCEWIEGLPFFDVLIMPDKDKFIKKTEE